MGTAATAETSTAKTYLGKKNTSGKYIKFFDIIKAPSLGQDRAEIKVTTLSDDNERSILGIGQTSMLEFSANFIPSVFDNIETLKDTDTDYCVALGDEGENGIFTFAGRASASIDEQSVGDARTMTVKIAVTKTMKKDSTAQFSLTESE